VLKGKGFNVQPLREGFEEKTAFLGLDDFRCFLG
jgi:hypothetical protein